LSFQLPFNQGDHILEVGGGERPLRVQGLKTTNVDIRALPTVDIVRDLEGDFSDLGKFDGIFSNWNAEHMSWRKIEGYFKSCYNVLKPGSPAVFVVPDTYKQIKKILQKPPEEINLDDSNLLYGGQGYSDDTHKVFFSRPFITKLLNEAGFKDVKIIDYPNPESQDMIVSAYKVDDKSDILTKINFGSFTVTTGDGWINCDIRGDIKKAVEAKGHIFEYCDVTKPLRWANNSVDLITAHHLVEHLTREEGSQFLCESFRILKPNGVIRLSTPDLETFIEKLGIFKETYAEEFEVKNAEDNADAFFRLDSWDIRPFTTFGR